MAEMRDEKKALILVWFLIAAAVGACLVAASLDRRPLDDPDLVFQRPGFLDAHGPPFPAPKIREGFRIQNGRLVLFFVRPEQAATLETALEVKPVLLREARLAVAVAADRTKQNAEGILWLADSSGGLAGGFHMPVPRDGGPPVGYAIVDSSGLVRYRTLDSGLVARLEEVETMLKATP